MHGKRPVRPPANEKQRTWQSGYGFLQAQIRAKAQRKALWEAKEIMMDKIASVDRGPF